MALSDILSLISKALNPTESIQVQKFILKLNAKVVELESENAGLKRKITDYDKWEQEKTRYEVRKTVPNTFLYRKKDTNEFFCPNCFEANKKTIHLQPPSGRAARWGNELFCPNCKTRYPHSTDVK